MLYLNTGTPGAGKSLFTIWTVEKRRQSDNKELHDKWVESGSDVDVPALVRDVYYFNINVKKLPWIKLAKPEDWLNCPIGSLIVFDECQEAFPPRANSSTPPKYVSELAKARHGGYDIYFITQHPTFVDPYVRKLAEEHNHLMRPWGAKKAVVHTWKGVKDNCDKSRKDSLTSSFSYPKEVFTWYKSAEVHTHKFKVPKKVIAMLLIPFLIAACVYGVYRYFNSKINPTLKPAITNSAIGTNGFPIGKQDKPAYVFDAASFRPRIDDVPWSAPRYDELTKPTIAPQVVGCIVFQGMCKCLTQQGTTHHATMQFCLATLENGIFQDFGGQAGGASSGQNQNAGSAQQNQTLPRPIANLQSDGYKVASVDSGFNLPVPSVQQQYDQKIISQPSGNLYYKK